MNLDEFLSSKQPPPETVLSHEEMARFFWKYKDLLKKQERDRAFWQATNANLEIASTAYQTLAENLPAIVYRIHLKENCRIQFFNKVAERITGFDERELREPIHALIVPQDRERVLAELKTALAKRKPFTLEYQVRHKEGGIRYLLEKGSPVFDKGGEPLHIDGVIFDITKRRQAEEQLRISLREKETLLQELCHRTKNNMQVVSSLLNLQSMTIKDEQLLQVIKETQNRIRSIALVHEKLYQSKELSNIELNDYIKDLADTLLRSYQVNADKISLSCDLDTVFVSIDTAIPCGLIINELISNSLKYAFSDDSKGEIRVSLGSAPTGEVELRIADNGRGLPEDFDFRNAKSLGLRLICQLAENQLRGTVKLNNVKGAEFLIKFKAQKLSKGEQNNGQY